MKKGLLYNSSPVSKLLFLVLIAVVSFGVTFFIGSLAALLIFHVSPLDLPSVFENIYEPGNLHILKYFQILQTVGLFIFPPFIAAWFYSSTPLLYLRLNKKTSFELFFVAGLAMLLALPVINFLAELNSRMNLPEFLSGIESWMKEKEVAAEQLTKLFVKSDSISDYFVNMVMIAILPAIGEELLFRGMIQRLFSDGFKSVHWGIIVASFLFSAFHLQFYGFIPRMLLGVFLGYIFVWSGNIWVPVFAHFVNNGAAVTAYYLLNESTVTKTLEEMGTTPDTLVFTILSAVIVGLLLFHFRNNVMIYSGKRSKQ